MNLIASVLILVLSSTSFGISLISLKSIELKFIEAYSDQLFTAAVAVIFPGAIITNILARRLKLKFKIQLILADWLFLAGYSLILLDQSIFNVFLGRFIIGLAIGIINSIVPIYMAQIAPKNHKEGFKALHTLGITLGIVFSYCSNIFTNFQTGYLINIAFLILHSFAIPNISSQEEVSSKPTAQSQIKTDSQTDDLTDIKIDGKSQQKAHGKMDDQGESIIAVTEQGNKEFTDEDASDKTAIPQTNSKSVMDFLADKKGRGPLCIFLLLHAGQHLSGINHVLIFLDRLFPDRYAPIYLNLLATFVTLLSSLLLDRFGLKWMILISSELVAVSFTLYLLKYSEKIALILFIIGFNLGLNSIPWSILDSIFDQSSLVPAGTIGITFNYFCAFVMILSVSFLQRTLGNAGLVVYIISMEILFLLVFVGFKEPQKDQKK